jgi:hypothetical protein
MRIQRPFRIAQPFGLEVEDVRAAIGTGGYNGITFRVDAGDRELLRASLAAKGMR